MISVVTWKWRPPAGYRSMFSADAVNILHAMVRRHYPKPFRFLCVTDDPVGLDPDIVAVPDFKDFAQVPSPHGGKNPSCYRRLRLFHPEAAQWFGDRFVSIDLDTVITDDLTPVFDRSEDFVAWGETDPRSFYNGSLMLLTAGARPQVWARFDPVRSPYEALRAGRFGSDQGHISHVLGRGEAVWTAADGVVSFRKHVQSNGGALPPGTKVVMFHGPGDPWLPEVQRACPWIQEHYC